MFDRRIHGTDARVQRAGLAPTPGKRTHAEQLEPSPHAGSAPASATGGAAEPLADAARPTLSSLFGRAEPPPRGALPAAIQRDAEPIVGASLADVRVHESAHAASLGAHAYASGKDVVFAPGRYDTTSREGLALLGHELAHVAQQGRGSVAGAQGKRGGVAADGALERAADRAGEQLAALATPTATRAEAMASGGVATDQLVQAKMGFELESDGGNRMPYLERRQMAYDDANFKIEPDSNNAIEFVSKPKDTLAELLQVVAAMRTAANQLAAGVKQPNQPLPTGFLMTPDEMGLEVKDRTWPVKPQQTAGLALHHLPGYLALRSPAADTGARTRHQTTRQQTFAKTDASTQEAKQFDALIALTLYYLRAFENRRIVGEKEGPKAVLDFMLRNSFYDLYHSIPGSNDRMNRRAFRRAVKDGLDAKRSRHVFPHGYSLAKDTVAAADQEALEGELVADLTIDRWITQIFEGMERPSWSGTGTDQVMTDGVSPPLPTPHPDQMEDDEKGAAYGMGAYRMDGNLALVEQRGQPGLKLIGSTAVEDWLTSFAGHLDEATAPAPARGPRARLTPSPFEAAVAALQASDAKEAKRETKQEPKKVKREPRKETKKVKQETEKETKPKRVAKPRTPQPEAKPQRERPTGEEPEAKRARHAPAPEPAPREPISIVEDHDVATWGDPINVHSSGFDPLGGMPPAGLGWNADPLSGMYYPGGLGWSADPLAGLDQGDWTANVDFDRWTLP